MTTDTLGGVWRYTVALAGASAASGRAVTVATIGPRPDHAQRAELATVAGVELVETDLTLDWTAPDERTLLAASAALARLARERGADSIHLHAPALVGNACWHAPVVAVVHSCLRTWWRAVRGASALPADLAWRDRAASAGLGRADAAIAPGRRFAREVARAYEVAEGRIHPVPNGAAPPAARPAQARPRAVLGCGRAWDAGKDFATLERAACLLQGIPVRLAGALLGPNGERAPVFDAVRTLGPLDLPTLAAARNDASVFVSTARYEPFGLAVLEAAQSGLALVLADIPSLREHWDGAALFFPPGDAGALAETIGAALDEVSPLAARARRRAEAFTPERMEAATSAVHDGLLPRPVGR